jgi:hypothetical protein
MPNVSSLMVPAYKRHRAGGQAVVRLAGRDIYLGKYAAAAFFATARQGHLNPDPLIQAGR